MTLASDATVEIEIAGILAGTQFDVLAVAAQRAQRKKEEREKESGDGIPVTMTL